MTTTFIRVLCKLAFCAVLSSALVLPMRADAHELQATIADLEVEDGAVQLSLRLNLEALLAGIDLDGLEDTDDAENAASYDALRALSAGQIAQQAPELLDGWNGLPLVMAGDTALTLESVAVDVPDGVPEDLPRLSQWELSADLPEGTRTLTVQWPTGAGVLVVRQQGVDAPYTGTLQGGQSTPALALAGGNALSGWQAFGSYIPVGFDHILPQGLDHILFVLGLFFMSMHLRPLLWQVTAFTLAHTVTLALGALGWVTISPAIVEPLIAASIVYVAVENIFLTGMNRWRPLFVFGFGLLHGLGFATVLGEFGLPEDQFIPAMLGFNVGVELGQIAVIAMAAIVIWVATQAAKVPPLDAEEAMVREYPVMFRAVSLTGSLIIALIGIWWVFERVFL